MQYTFKKWEDGKKGNLKSQSIEKYNIFEK